jgi:uncharacterized repeat protein (TIGR03803 family)
MINVIINKNLEFIYTFAETLKPNNMKKISLLASALLLIGIGVAQAQITSLKNLPEDSYAYGSLTLSGNVLYGMTEDGGTHGEGNIFAVNTDGSNYRDIFDFEDTGSKAFRCTGRYPYVNNLTIVGNTLFGMTEEGGFHNDGTVFSIHTDGTCFRDLWDFSDTSITFTSGDGYDPEGSLIAIGGKLFGMTEEGGFWGSGTIFSLDTSYAMDSAKARRGYKLIWNFHENADSNGGYPEYGHLTASANNTVLYGMTEEGGKDDEGNIFSIDTNGAHYKDLWDFDVISDDGRYPYGSVTLSGNKLYGMTADGGWWNDGTIFSINTNGSNYQQLYGFEDTHTSGEEPYGDLTIAGNMMYGMTEDGGFNYDGMIFAIDTNGSNFSDIFDFDYDNYGEEPYGSLVVSNGNAYGMSYYGGPLGGGVVFSLDLCGMATTKITGNSTPDNGTGTGTATANATGNGPTPYTYMWAPGGQTNATATGLIEGTYTVTVTSANGCQTWSTVEVGSTLGVNNISANTGITVYPNPNNGSFTVALSGTTDKSTVEVYNTLGQQVYTHSLVSGNNILDMNAAGGVYMYRVISNDGSLIGQGKLVIQK